MIDSINHRKYEKFANVAEALLAGARDSNNEFILECRGKKLGYNQIAAAVSARQLMLMEIGVVYGSRVAIFSGRGAEYWLDMLAVWASGAVTVPVDPSATSDELEQIISKARPSVFVGNVDIDTLGVASIASLDGKTTKAEPSFYKIKQNDTASILFTSGSSGKRKGVELSAYSVLHNSFGILDLLLPVGGDRLMIATPFHFTSSINHFLAAMLSGMSFIAFEDKLMPADLFNNLIDSRADCFGGAPIQIRWISDMAEGKDPKLRWVMSSGDRMDAEVLSRLHARMPETSAYVIYGLTELGGRYCGLKIDFNDLATGRVGRPIAKLTTKIRDENGNEMPNGTIGEIFADGPLLFKGYINDPDATEATMGAYGFRTGDIGYIDPLGNLVVEGRSDDVFKVQGQKVSAKSIEAVLIEAGNFADVAVVEGLDPRLGVVPVAFYVPKDGSSVDIGSAKRAVREKLPSNHMPRKMIQCESIPRTGSGKIIKSLLSTNDK